MPITFTFKRTAPGAPSATTSGAAVLVPPALPPSIAPVSIDGDDPLDVYMRGVAATSTTASAASAPTNLLRGEICTADDSFAELVVNDDGGSPSHKRVFGGSNKRARTTNNDDGDVTAKDDGDASDFEFDSSELPASSSHYDVTPLLRGAGVASLVDETAAWPCCLAPLAAFDDVGGGGVGAGAGAGAGRGVGPTSWASLLVDLTPPFPSFWVSPPLPIHSWSQIRGLPPALTAAAVARGLSAPTPVQSALLPLLLAGLDVCGVAPTGSGKTAAFLLPLLAAAAAARAAGAGAAKAGRSTVLIINPTRELAAQTAGLARQLARAAAAAAAADVGGGENVADAGLSPALGIALLSGGASAWDQEVALRSAAVAVGTPGRIIALARGARAPLFLPGITHLVLDEADRLLDMGFGPTVRSIVSAACAPGRVTALLTATLPPSARALAAAALAASRTITVNVRAERGGGALAARSALASHEAVITRGGDAGKVSFIVQELPSLIARAYAYDADVSLEGADAAADAAALRRVIIFVNSHANAEALGTSLSRAPRVIGVFGSSISVTASASVSASAVAVLHGGMDQASRDAALRGFRTGVSRCLVATDVAARGLDVPGVALVISADVPRGADALVHRAGRAGRTGAGGGRTRGLVISLIDGRDAAGARVVSSVLRSGGHFLGADLNSLERGVTK